MAFDFIVFLDAYPYNLRYQHQPLVTSFWAMAALPFVGAFVLDFKALRTRPGNAAHASEAWFARLDSLGLLIPIAILAGLTITHTIVLIHDITIDSTTHNLFPFEYIYAWIVMGIPAVIGSLLARGMCWALHRFQKR